LLPTPGYAAPTSFRSVEAVTVPTVLPSAVIRIWTGVLVRESKAQPRTRTVS
jgi:hypothetical protein